MIKKKIYILIFYYDTFLPFTFFNNSSLQNQNNRLISPDINDIC